ncbi:MAG: cyclic nucleotide-binding domain-containing protein [Gammaproteobacteria bacterium]|nr:cyclic nucleotide-binding domain-containing protein [Gammaproteobacteria bacterium]MCZ6827963.1 cyclic nucleotide-binding domain-containing protein [Gammaproteobacteria bacterium]MCZ6881292.1 cyclic nucleotide-binding domain-containing protein [Gammaproteobacteria bacterium]
MKEKPVTTAILRKLSPLDGLQKENLDSLVKKTAIHSLEAGRVLFREGDQKKRTVYVISGELLLLSGGEEVAVIEGGTKEAAHPVAHVIPRKVTAKARNRVEYLAIDSDLLDVMLTWDQTGSYEVGELGLDTGDQAASDDWMLTLLQTKAFHKIPPANIQAIFMRMQQVNHTTGDVIIKQGDEGDYFYVVIKGSCNVTRETPLNKDGIKLADLTIGDTFGEEALISDARRNATITMSSDGSLMRLAKEDFKSLLNEPMLKWVNKEQADEIVGNDGIWLDVRLPSEFENFHEPDAINIPLYFIRLKLSTLDKDKRYVVCCDTGRRSSAGAYILNERGFDAFVLRDGLEMSEKE